MNEQKQAFMRRAIELSKTSVKGGGGGPFGAVIVKDGKIIGEGSNQVTVHNDPTAHAEVEAIRAACKSINDFSLAGSEIYTSCEPCPMCLAAIYWARIDKIYFANTRKDAAHIQFDDDHIYSEMYKGVFERQIPAEQILRDEALAIFRSWQEKADKIPY